MKDNFTNSSEKLGDLKTGAIILAHDDTKEEKNKRKTTYLCGHVFRIATEIKNQANHNLKYNGFIHISKNAHENQYFDVLSTVIKIYFNKLLYNKIINIMISGFTKFGNVIDNPTSRFLFNDGTSNNYGLMNAYNIKIDNMMKDKFGETITEPCNIFKEINNTKIQIGRSYEYHVNEDKKIINLTFLRLPVDEDLSIDNTGKNLKEAINTVNPDAIISFGAGTDENENYYIETCSYGMIEKGAIYNNGNEFVVNNDLSKMFKEYFAYNK